MTMSDTRNEHKAIMRKIGDIFVTGDLAQVHALIAPDYLDHQGLDGVVITGRQGFHRVVTAARTGLPQLRIVIHDLIAEDDKVVARLRWQSIDQAGNRIDRETIDILRLVNGQAVEHWGAVV